MQNSAINSTPKKIQLYEGSWYPAFSPATNSSGFLSGYSSIWRAMYWPSKWAYHWPCFLWVGSSRNSSEGRANGIRKNLCWLSVVGAPCLGARRDSDAVKIHQDYLQFQGTQWSNCSHIITMSIILFMFLCIFSSQNKKTYSLDVLFSFHSP